MFGFGEIIKHSTHVGFGDEHGVPTICSKCKGKKKVIANLHAPSSSSRPLVKCDACNGTGKGGSRHA
jgi:hypothetical protein